MSIIDQLKKVPSWVLVAISIVLILVAISLSFKANVKKFEELSDQSLSYFDEAYKKSVKLSLERHSDSLSSEQIDILMKKVSIIEENKNHHADLISKLYKNNYALLTLFPFLSAITAILAFLILQKGWNDSNNYVKTYFIIFTTITTLVGIYPEVYQQSESIAKNLDTYTGYTKIQKTIFSYSLTAPVIEKDTVDFNTFLDRINTQEKNMTSIIFDLEKKTVNQDIFELK